MPWVRWEVSWLWKDIPNCTTPQRQATPPTAFTILTRMPVKALTEATGSAAPSSALAITARAGEQHRVRAAIFRRRKNFLDVHRWFSPFCKSELVVQLRFRKGNDLRLLRSRRIFLRCSGGQCGFDRFFRPVLVGRSAAESGALVIGMGGQLIFPVQQRREATDEQDGVVIVQAADFIRQQQFPGRKSGRCARRTRSGHGSWIPSAARWSLCQAAWRCTHGWTAHCRREK